MRNLYKIAAILIMVMAFVACEEEMLVPEASTVADFNYEAPGGLTAPATVSFSNSSILATSFLWDFGNGETSTEDNPTVTYTEPGIYSITLTAGATNDVYYNQLVKQVSLNIKDPNAGKVKRLYFTDRTTHSVRYVTLDGNEPVITDFGHTGLDKPYGMAIDTANARVIVSDYREGVIYSYDLDGFDLQVVINLDDPVLYDPFGLEVIEDKLYWGTEWFIGRCNMDGSDAEEFITLGPGAPEMAIDLQYNYLTNEFIFTNDKYEFTGGMYSISMDGSTATELVPGTNGGAMVLDVEANKMYYADYDKGVCMANMDGSDEVIIAPEMKDVFCWGMAIDLDAGKLYWSDKTNGKIVRANLDGSEKEDFVTGCNPYAMEIDMFR